MASSWPLSRGSEFIVLRSLGHRDTHTGSQSNQTYFMFGTVTRECSGSDVRRNCPNQGLGVVES